MTAIEALALYLCIFNKMRTSIWLAKRVRYPSSEATLALAGGSWRRPHPSLRSIAMEFLLREVTT
jgi:hypothetical protein